MLGNKYKSSHIVQSPIIIVFNGIPRILFVNIEFPHIAPTTQRA